MAIERPRGLLLACLRAAGRQVYPVNPMAVARYRDRHSVSGRKSDKGDALEELTDAGIREDTLERKARERDRAVEMLQSIELDSDEDD